MKNVQKKSTQFGCSCQIGVENKHLIVVFNCFLLYISQHGMEAIINWKSFRYGSEVCLDKLQPCQVYDFDQDAWCFDQPASFCQHACSFHSQIGPNYVKHIVL